MSTTAKPYRLTIDNVTARAKVARGEIEGSSFPEMTSRSFSTLRSAEGRARNILNEQYDPRLSIDDAPRAIVEFSLNGTPRRKVFVMLSGGLRLVDDITDADRAEADRRVTR